MKPGKHFLEDYFKAAGNHHLWLRSMEHFESAFVEPPRFERILTDLKPVDGRLKVVVVDGHPRSGKSWTVIKALEQIIDDLSLEPDEWWTSSLDSLAVAKGGDDLYTSALAVEEQLRLRPNLRMVLLDDFLGTNELRPIGRSIWDDRVRAFLDWNRTDNPWLRHMRDGSVFVVTGRSLHFMLVEILLNSIMREAVSDTENRLLVINSRRGLFQTVEKGEPFGAFDRKTLAMLCENNRKYHPLKDEDLDWFILATPLVAFDDCIAGPESEREGHLVLTSQQKQLAASGLFGEDIDGIAKTLKDAEDVVEHDLAESRRERTLTQLYKAYLVTIAPGLLFMNQAAYSQLNLDDEIRDLVVKGLYLSEQIEEFCSGRLPNEFYMIALNAHFAGHLELAAKAFASVVNPNGLPLTDVKGIPALGLRGFLERGLHRRSFGSLETLRGVREFQTLVDTYLNFENDCLLQLERGDAPSSDNCGKQMSPGLAAAIGWTLNSFFKASDPKVQEAVSEWFPASFKFLLEELDSNKKNWKTDPKFPGDVRNQQKVPDFYREKWRVTAAYSAFLQWVIKMDPSPEKGGLLDSILNSPDLSTSFLCTELSVIIEDQLIWAFGELGYPQETSLEIDHFLTFLIDDSQSRRRSAIEDNYIRANRLFSLAWHNKWMNGPDTNFKRKAVAWLKHHETSILKELSENPEVLDDNLQYHWFHFIAQRAVWMRDWCFEDNPMGFERNYSQIAEGSEHTAHNDLFSIVAKNLLNNVDTNKERVRNLLMLLGTRAARIRDFDELVSQLDELLEGNRESSQELKRSVLQAIFELARQGFFEDSNVNTTPQFRAWCLHKVQMHKPEIALAWGPYWDGLSSMTHLDLLPREHEGWHDVLPKAWQKGL